MTWANFQAAVLAFLNRASTDVPTVGSQNLVVICANMAKAEAQRRHYFKMSRTVAYITSSMAGADMTTALFTTPSSSVVVPVRRVEQAWQFSTVSPFYRYKRVPYMTLGDLKFEYGSTTLLDINQSVPTNSNFYVSTDIKWYIQGTSFFLLGVTSPTMQVSVDVCQWMPDYDGSITDFFLTYHFDWMLLKTVDNLNRYLKEDQRTQVAVGDLEKRWMSVTALDENFGEDSFEAGAI